MEGVYIDIVPQTLKNKITFRKFWAFLQREFYLRYVAPAGEMLGVLWK